MHTNWNMPESARDAGSVPLSALLEASQTLSDGNTVTLPAMSPAGMLPLRRHILHYTSNQPTNGYKNLKNFSSFIQSLIV